MDSSKFLRRSEAVERSNPSMASRPLRSWLLVAQLLLVGISIDHDCGSCGRRASAISNGLI